MATRSTIALEFADGTVQQIYCHWDGYLDHNGQILLEHYSDPFKLRDLIDQGAISSLGPELGVKHDFAVTAKYGTPEYHAEMERRRGMTTFYARDRGEELIVHKFANYGDYLKNAQFEEYNYILRQDGDRAVWFVEFHSGDFRGRLTEAFEYEANQREDA